MSFQVMYPALYSFAIAHGYGHMAIDDINTARALAKEMLYPHPIQPWDDIQDTHRALNTYLIRGDT